MTENNYFKEKELLEERAKAHDEMEAILQKADNEKRSNLTKEERRKFDAWELEYTRCNDELNILKRNQKVKEQSEVLSGKRSFKKQSREDSMSKNYSIARAIRHLVKPNDSANDAGFEVEISQELQARSGQSLKPGEIIIPIQALKTESRDIDYSTEGSNLVQTEHMEAAFIDVLRNSSQVLSMGVTQLSDLRDNIKIPKKSTSSTGYWFDGDSENITASTQTFTNLSMEPHYVGALSEFTYRLLEQGSPAIEQIVRQDLADTLGVEIDRAALDGAGSSSEPKGVLNTSGVNVTTFSGSSPTWSEIVTLEENLAIDNALMGNLGFIAYPTYISKLKTTEKASGTGQFIMQDGLVNNYPARFSKNMPGNYMLFGDWSQLIFGAWGGIKLAVNPYEKFASGSVQVRAIAAVDFAVRHSNSFEIARIANT